jgi:hypothetical protein
MFAAVSAWHYKPEDKSGGPGGMLCVSIVGGGTQTYFGKQAEVFADALRDYTEKHGWGVYGLG